MAFEADYAYTGSRHDDFNHNINLTYNPATGTNYPFSDISRRAYPEFGILGLEYMALLTNTHQLQTAFTKRMSNRWQASATYTLAGYWDRDAQPLSGLGGEVPFPVTPDLGGEYSFAENDQRHRAVFNGIWDMGYGFQLSGLYFFGSGARFFTNYGGDLRNTGGANRIDGRLRPDGTIVPRNNLVGQPAASRRPAHPAAVRVRQPREAGRDPRGVQSVQPRELRLVRHRREQPELRAADAERQHRVPAAYAAGRLPRLVLTVAAERTCHTDGPQGVPAA